MKQLSTEEMIKVLGGAQSEPNCQYLQTMWHMHEFTGDPEVDGRWIENWDREWEECVSKL